MKRYLKVVAVISCILLNVAGVGLVAWRYPDWRPQRLIDQENREEERIFADAPAFVAALNQKGGAARLSLSSELFDQGFCDRWHDNMQNPKGKGTTVARWLVRLGAVQKGGKILDRDGKEVIFYHRNGGTAHKRDELPAQTREIEELRRHFTVVVYYCAFL